MNRSGLHRIGPAILLIWLAACVNVQKPDAVARTAADAGRVIGAACPPPLRPATLEWLAGAIEKDPSPDAVAAGDDIDRIDRQADACRKRR